LKHEEHVVTRLYQVQDFAEVAGVTVRALHYYDRLKLLQPRRTDAGYRLYSLCDLERLEQIAALKLLGLPLRQIKEVLDRDGRKLPDVLRAQRRALEERRRQLDRVIKAIGYVERTILPDQPPDAALLKRLIEVMDMQDNAEQMKKYYSDEAWAEMARRREQMTPEMREAATQGSQLWLDLYRDIGSALDEPPDGERAQALLARWRDLVQSFTSGNKEIEDGLKNAWAHRRDWPTSLQHMAEPFSDPRIWAFIADAAAAQGGR
jgi:DNA-binding transcriptional MerR regulator